MSVNLVVTVSSWMFWCNKAIAPNNTDILYERESFFKKLLHAPCWQEVGPDVYRLVVHLEAAEDAVQRRAARVAVSRDDAVLPEHLRTKETFQVSNYTVRKSAAPYRVKCTVHLLLYKGRSEGSIPAACRQ